MTWTLWKQMSGAGAVKVGEFATKREMVTAMNAVRAPKSAVVRVGRDYTVTPNT